MPTLTIKDEKKQLRLDRILLVSDDDTFIDLSLLFTDLVITESIENKFMMGEITLNSEYDIRESSKMLGKSKIKIVWSTGTEYETRSHTFTVLDIPMQADLTENVMETMTISFVDERYFKILKNEPYEIFTEETAANILTTMLANVDITANIEATTELMEYYWMQPMMKSINQVRFANNPPLVLFQQNNAFIGRTWETLFNNNSPLEFEIVNPNRENKTNDRMFLLRNMEFKDIVDAENLYDGGLGNKLLVRDIWNKTFTSEDKKLEDSSIVTSKQKSFTDGIIRDRVLFPNYKYIEDYILTDYLEADIAHGISSLFVGNVISIDIPSKKFKNATSVKSGNYLIYELTHRFDRNLNYSQEVVLIKKELFKSLS